MFVILDALQNTGPQLQLNSPPAQFPSAITNGPPVDCMVSEWSAWSACNAACGSTGYFTKFRMIKRPAENGGKPCPIKLNKKRVCSGVPCY